LDDEVSLVPFRGAQRNPLTDHSLIVNEQIKPALVDRRTRLKSGRGTQLRRIESASVPLRDRLIELIEKLNRINLGRGSDAPCDDVLLHTLVMVMINIGIAPAIRAKHLNTLGMCVDDCVFVEVDTRIR
jgi:hypothetical protein